MGLLAEAAGAEDHRQDADRIPPELGRKWGIFLLPTQRAHVDKHWFEFSEQGK